MESKKLNRKQLRLNNFDYSTNGAYFITICTYHKEKILCEIIRRGDPCGLPITTYFPLGQIAKETLSDIEIPGSVCIDKYVIMPNHVHLLIMLAASPPDRGKPCHYNITGIIGKYKSLVAHKWREVCKQRNIQMGTIWQRSFHDHIIRGEKDYLEIWKYIDENPLKWEYDKYFR